MPSLVITRDTVSVRLQSDRLELIRHSDPEAGGSPQHASSGCL